MKKYESSKIEELTNRMLDGDLKAREELILYNERLITLVIKGGGIFSTTIDSFEDLVSIGRIGLIKGIDSYNPSKNCKLAAYLTACIRNEIYMYFRKIKKLPLYSSLDSPIDEDSPNSPTIISEIPDDNDFISRIEDQDIIDVLISLIESLPPRDCLIIKYYFGIGCDPKNQGEISKIIGTTQGYVSKRIRTILKKLSLDVEKENSYRIKHLKKHHNKVLKNI